MAKSSSRRKEQQRDEHVNERDQEEEEEEDTRSRRSRRGEAPIPSARRARPAPEQSSGARRRTRSNVEEEEEEEGVPEEAAGDVVESTGTVVGFDDNDEVAGGNAQAKAALSRMNDEERAKAVHDLVRLALCSEKKKTPIRRDDVAKRLLVNARAFPLLLAAANAQLRDFFGLELVPLPSRVARKPGSAQAARKAASAAASAHASGTFTVVNRLDPGVRAEALQWGPEAAEMGKVMVILSFIFVHNKEVERHTEALVRHLRKFGLRCADSDPAVVEETLFGFALRQLYVERVRRQSGDKDVTFLVPGPRAKAEIPDDVMVQFIVDTFGAEESQREKLKMEVLRSSGFIAAA